MVITDAATNGIRVSLPLPLPVLHGNYARSST
jgi:hypothetical protein